MIFVLLHGIHGYTIMEASGRQAICLKKQYSEHQTKQSRECRDRKNAGQYTVVTAERYVTMEWTKAIQEAVNYIESHITEDITMCDAAEHVNISPFYFNKGFSILCGYSITEYIRNRRLALAGKEIFSEWLPALQDYEFAAGYCVEMYDAPDKYPKGTGDENYYTEIWIPVRKK